MPTKDQRADIIPSLRYRDAPAALDWLCTAFGFEARFVVPDAEGGIAHARLTFGRQGMRPGGNGVADGMPTPWPSADVGVRAPVLRHAAVLGRNGLAGG